MDKCEEAGASIGSRPPQGLLPNLPLATHQRLDRSRIEIESGLAVLMAHDYNL